MQLCCVWRFPQSFQVTQGSVVATTHARVLNNLRVGTRHCCRSFTGRSSYRLVTAMPVAMAPEVDPAIHQVAPAGCPSP